MKVFGTENFIPTDAPFNPKVEHALAGRVIDRGPTVDGRTSIVIQGVCPGELIYRILDEPFIHTPKQSSSAPYSVPSGEPVKKAS